MYLTWLNILNHGDIYYKILLTKSIGPSTKAATAPVAAPATKLP